jgi:orotate phosphoribosyltransferase-like protein
MQADAIAAGQTVVVVDDIIATGCASFVVVEKSWINADPSSLSGGLLVCLQVDLLSLQGNS